MGNIENYQKISLGIGLASIVLLTIISPLVSDLSYRLQSIPFLISIVFIGLPHGAMDPLIPSRVSELSVKKSIIIVSILYLISSSIYAIFWIRAPIVALSIFILMTWFHWGQGDIYAMNLAGFDLALKNKWYRNVSLATRGGIPMIIPLLSYPKAYTEFLSTILSLFSVNSSILFKLKSTRLALILSSFIGVLIILNLILGALCMGRQNIRYWFYDIFEIGMLALYFSTVPPLLAVGIYFCSWHSIRHIMRVSLIENQQLHKEISEGRISAYLKDLFWDTIGITLISVILLIIAGILALGELNLKPFIAFYLVFISVLTLPHVILVTWMDSKQFE